MIQVTRDTNNVIAVRRVIDIAKQIDVLEPDAAPLTQLMKKISKKVAINPEFKWMEEESLVKNDLVNYSTNYTAGDTQITVDHGTRFRVGDVVKVMATGEQLLVTVVATNLLDVQRGWGSTSAGAILDDGVLLIVGNANKEGASKRTIKVNDQTPVTNYTQIFRTPFGITRTADNSEMYGGGDLKHQRMTQLIEHQKEMERAFWFGEPKEDLSLMDHPIRATGGVDYFISTGADNATGTLTEMEFDTFLMNGFRYGSKTKWLFAAPIILAAINYWAKGKLLVAPKDKTYGLSVMQYLTPFGTVNIVLNNIFSETTTYAGYGYLLDLEGIKYRPLANSDTKLKTNIQANDADGEEDEYLTEAGLHFSLEKKSRLLYGVTSFT
jgi:hypothetical protein